MVRLKIDGGLDSNKCGIYRVLLNSTDKFKGVTVGSMGTANHHRTWGRKSRLVGIIRKNGYEWYDAKWNKKGYKSVQYKCITYYFLVGTMGSLGVRASDSGSECLGSMPNPTKYPPSTHEVSAR
ncbi:hypothetical protein TNCV_2980461 [Trichonephila clavipes]|nr:hypothetical protein TNCV_2980461 [Trichonephila clavipes]